MRPELVTLSSVLTRPADTTAYAQNDLLASSVTAGSIVVPSFAMPEGCLGLEIVGGRLITNLTTGFTTFAGKIDLWKGAAGPTFTNGDNGAYAVATGAAKWSGNMQTDVASQFADGAVARISNGTTYDTKAVRQVLAIGPADNLYWSLKESDATGFTPVASQTFTFLLDAFLWF